jgi:hypothetical protein
MPHGRADQLVAGPPGAYSPGHENPPTPGSDDPDPVPAGHAGAGVGVRGAYVPPRDRPDRSPGGRLLFASGRRWAGEAWAPSKHPRLSPVRLALCHRCACPPGVRPAVARPGRAAGIARRVGGPLLPLHVKLPLPASDLPSSLSDAAGLATDPGACVGPTVTLGVARKRQRRRGPPEDDEHVPVRFC